MNKRASMHESSSKLLLGNPKCTKAVWVGGDGVPSKPTGDQLFGKEATYNLLANADLEAAGGYK